MINDWKNTIEINGSGFYETRSEQRVKILYNDKSYGFPWKGKVDGDYSFKCWTTDGRYGVGCMSTYDIVKKLNGK